MKPIQGRHEAYTIIIQGPGNACQHLHDAEATCGQGPHEPTQIRCDETNNTHVQGIHGAHTSRYEPKKSHYIAESGQYKAYERLTQGPHTNHEAPTTPSRRCTKPNEEANRDKSDTTPTQDLSKSALHMYEAYTRHTQGRGHIDSRPTMSRLQTNQGRHETYVRLIHDLYMPSIRLVQDT